MIPYEPPKFAKLTSSKSSKSSKSVVFLDSENGIFKDNPWPIFAFFTVMMALQLVWIIAKVPETKGVSLEELQKKLAE